MFPSTDGVMSIIRTALAATAAVGQRPALVPIYARTEAVPGGRSSGRGSEFRARRPSGAANRRQSG